MSALRFVQTRLRLRYFASANKPVPNCWLPATCLIRPRARSTDATMATTAAVIVAAGRGSRAQRAPASPSSMLPGRRAGPRPLAARSDRAPAGRRASASSFTPTTRPSTTAAAAPFAASPVAPVPGERRGRHSVRAGLEALRGAAPDRVLIHDAARPFVTADLVEPAARRARHDAGAIAAEPVSRHAQARGRRRHDRAHRRPRRPVARADPAGVPLRRRSSPRTARAAAAGRCDFTDDAGLAEWAGLAVKLVASSRPQHQADDRRRHRRWPSVCWRPPLHLLEPRTGTGFDVHRFARRRSRVAVRGEDRPHASPRGPLGRRRRRCMRSPTRSSAPSATATSASTFPPSDPKWRGARSRIFLERRGRSACASSAGASPTST